MDPKVRDAFFYLLLFMNGRGAVNTEKRKALEDGRNQFTVTEIKCPPSNIFRFWVACTSFLLLWPFDLKDFIVCFIGANLPS